MSRHHPPPGAGECRVTDWQPFPFYGLTHYRIWVCKGDDLPLWFQRHEWKRDDGSTDLENWIPTPVSRWLPGSRQVVAG